MGEGIASLGGTATFGALAPYVMIVVAAALPTHLWRWLGVLFAGRLDENSEAFVYVRAVATAMVAAVISRLVLFPTGALAELAPALRLAAMVAGLAVYIAAGKRLLLGILAAEAVLLAAWFATVKGR